MLINGEWKDKWNPYQASNDKGEFLRQTSEFRNWITADGSRGPTGDIGYPAEPGRYHLYVAFICPWASRTLMVRSLKKLESIISVDIVEPFLTEQGWKFGDFPGSTSDSQNNFTYIHQLYTSSSPRYSGRATIPILWDKETSTIINNESADIINMLNSSFNEWTDSTVNLRPVRLLDDINKLNDKLYNRLNNGVYRAGFAQSQDAYQTAFEDVFSCLDEMELRLSKSPFLLGNEITEPDIRLFVTLIRFDSAYYGLFKCNKKRIADYPNLSKFLQRNYQLPGIKDTANITHIKSGYYSVKDLNPKGIVPAGPELNFL